jgi:DNA topoisomerase-1
VKELERCGVGRPSTYSAIVATLLDRRYVTRTKGRLEPTELGFAVTDLLVARFPELLSVGYTAALEERLDAIETGQDTLIGALAAFWERFAPALEAARREPASRVPPPAESRIESPVESLVGSASAPPSAVACPRCHEGRVVERRSGERIFFGCSRFPACRFTSNRRPLGESCPECGDPCLFEKETARDGRVVFCGNEACHYHRSD